MRPSTIYRFFIPFFIVISLFMMDGLRIAHSKVLSSAEEKIIGFVKTFYAPDEVNVRLKSRPKLLNTKAKIEAISFAKVPDEDGAGLCLIEMVDQRGKPRSIYVPIKVSKKRPLFVAKRELLKGEVLTDEDIKINYTALTGRTSRYPSSLEDTIGRVLKRDIKKGTVITTDVIEDPVMVRRGKMVILIGESKRLLIKTQGKALENGRLGNVIKVKNITSGKVVHATVTGENTVKVDL